MSHDEIPPDEPAVILRALLLHDPPTTLPPKLKDIYERASSAVTFAACMGSAPGRIDPSLDRLSQQADRELAASYDTLKTSLKRLDGWRVANEVELRFNAPDVYTICGRIVEAVRSILGLAERLVVQRGVTVEDPPDAAYLAFRAATGRSSDPHPRQLARDIHAAGAALADLRSALRNWSMRIVQPDPAKGGAAPLAAAGTGNGRQKRKGTRGRKTNAQRAVADTEDGRLARLRGQVLDRLIEKAGPKHKWKAALAALKLDRQFREQVEEACLPLDENLINRARRKSRSAAQTK
jgi:hypothetical protein